MKASSIRGVGLVLTVFAGAAAGQVHKCTFADGRVVYQDYACAAAAAQSARLDSGIGSPVYSAGAPDARAAASVERLRVEVMGLDLERQRRAIASEITTRETLLRDLEIDMERDLERLGSGNALIVKNQAGDNLIAAVWDSRVQQELRATTEKYRARIQSVQERLSDLRREQERLAARK